MTRPRRRFTHDLPLDEVVCPTPGDLYVRPRTTYRITAAHLVDSRIWGNRWALTCTRIDPVPPHLLQLTDDARTHQTWEVDGDTIAWHAAPYPPGVTPTDHFGVPWPPPTLPTTLPCGCFIADATHDGKPDRLVIPCSPRCPHMDATLRSLGAP